MMAERKSAMTIRAYRITSAGERVELARSAIAQGEPYEREITGIWPDCACVRCTPAEDEAQDAMTA